MTSPLSPGLVPLQPPTPGPTPACGHTDADRLRTWIHPAKLPRYFVDNQNQVVRRVAGGDRELRLDDCSICRLSIGYRLRRLGAHAEEVIGGDPQIVQAALAAVLEQPGVDIFSIDIIADGARHVIPRHHLPAFQHRE